VLKLSIPTYLRNAASALIGRRGAVSERARQAGCSRQTVYNDAHELCQRLEERDCRLQQLQAENAQLREENKRLQEKVREAVTIDDQRLRCFAVTAQAMGVSLRQTEELLTTVLPAKRVPDHTTMGRWTVEAGRRAGEVLATLDPLCAPIVQTLAVDEIFFGG
jgi:hypothetical protein